MGEKSPAEFCPFSCLVLFSYIIGVFIKLFIKKMMSKLKYLRKMGINCKIRKNATILEVHAVPADDTFKQI